jgi:antitoxin (DNA-binding transcriptional repressor) of toxin-antitoxin stability system
MRISITEAKRDLENLIDRAHRGEEIIISRWNRPVVRLEALSPPKIKNQSWRRIAGCSCAKSPLLRTPFNIGIDEGRR